MKPYFEKMDDFGKPLRPAQIDRMKESAAQAEAVMAKIDEEAERIKNYGLPVEKVHQRGEMTIWERIDYIVDPGTFCPLHTIFDPGHETSGSTNIVDGLARISGKWCVLVGFTTNGWRGHGSPGSRITCSL